MIEALFPIAHNGDNFEAGDVLEATAGEEESLVEIGVARFVQPDEETAEVLEQVIEPKKAKKSKK